MDLVLKGAMLDLRKINRIHLDLEDLNLPYSFDLSIYHRIDNPELLGHIERVGKILYQREL